MTVRRQKNISDALNSLEKALDQREQLLAKLVRCEMKIRTLRKRSNRAQKSFVAKGCASVAAGMSPSPYCGDRDIGGEFNDDIPDLTA